MIGCIVYMFLWRSCAGKLNQSQRSLVSYKPFLGLAIVLMMTWMHRMNNSRHQEMGWLRGLTRNSRFSRIHAAHICTLIIQRTAPALWPLRMADLPAMTNQVNM